jgi:hypothetical protein
MFRRPRRRIVRDTIICWLTGYTKAALAKQIKAEVDFETFFDEAPKMKPNVNQSS